MKYDVDGRLVCPHEAVQWLSKWARDEAALLAPLCPASWLSYSAVRMYCRAGGGTERFQTELDGVPTALKRSEKRGGVGGGGDVRELAHCSPSLPPLQRLGRAR